MEGVDMGSTLICTGMEWPQGHAWHAALGRLYQDLPPVCP